MKYIVPELREVNIEDIMDCACACGLLAGGGGGCIT